MASAMDTLKCAIKIWLSERFKTVEITDDIVDHYVSVLIDEAENFE